MSACAMQLHLEDLTQPILPDNSLTQENLTHAILSADIKAIKKIHQNFSQLEPARKLVYLNDINFNTIENLMSDHQRTEELSIAWHTKPFHLVGNAICATSMLTALLTGAACLVQTTDGVCPSSFFFGSFIAFATSGLIVSTGSARYLISSPLMRIHEYIQKIKNSKKSLEDSSLV